MPVANIPLPFTCRRWRRQI